MTDLSTKTFDDIDNELLEYDYQLYEEVLELESIALFDTIWSELDRSDNITDVEENVYTELERTYTFGHPDSDLKIEVCLNLIHKYCDGVYLNGEFHSYKVIESDKMDMKKFNTAIREWIIPMGYQEIYKINHPTENHNEVHFIKNGIRICCFKDVNDMYWNLNAEVYLKPEKEILTLKTGKYKLFSDNSLVDLERMVKVMIEKKNILENKLG